LEEGGTAGLDTIGCLGWVYGLPSVALDDYLALWALGDVFGKTKEIDITFTK
jgi:hypothetical protein